MIILFFIITLIILYAYFFKLSAMPQETVTNPVVWRYQMLNEIHKDTLKYYYRYGQSIQNAHNNAIKNWHQKTLYSQGPSKYALFKELLDYDLPTQLKMLEIEVNKNDSKSTLTNNNFPNEERSLKESHSRSLPSFDTKFELLKSLAKDILSENIFQNNNILDLTKFLISKGDSIEQTIMTIFIYDIALQHKRNQHSPLGFIEATQKATSVHTISIFKKWLYSNKITQSHYAYIVTLIEKFHFNFLDAESVLLNDLKNPSINPGDFYKLLEIINLRASIRKALKSPVS